MKKRIQFRTKPVEVAAMQIPGNHKGIQQVINWVNANTPQFNAKDSDTWVISAYYGEITLRTPEGEMKAYKGDWVVLLGGKFRTFTADVFNVMFESYKV